jgi:prolyl-tRNA editing enzyme YbaK/EbsC (Cys-tRNA(Pro) deacylase)
VIPHRHAYTSIDEARALGIDAGDVLKTLVVRTTAGYVLMVIPASGRLDPRLARHALGDNHARLATEEELGRDFAGYQLGALPPLAGLLGAAVCLDPEVLRHEVVAFAAGAQTSRSRCEPTSCSAAGRSPRCRCASSPTAAATTRSLGAGRRSRP